MSKHSPIIPDPEQGGTPPRAKGLTLVERAAKVYDFNGAVRAPRPLRPVAEASPQAAVPDAIDPSWAAAPAEPRRGSVNIEDLREGGFILPDAPPSALSEEFRIVKRQLLVAAEGLPHGRTILVTSARPDDGKTFCAINLALSLAAEKDVEVVLIDAEVAKPEILSTLGLENGPGLLDAVADPAVDVEACLIRTDIGGLTVLPAGRQTNEATELLASARTNAVLERLRRRSPARVILFDSPPALAASPASALAMHCGQALVVVRAEKTSERDLREALDLLAACPKPQLLLNGVEYGGGSRRFGGGYYGYGD
ncbi:MAG TPA: exopolysaccharide biosynthesis protein [Sphingomonas sp.]|nr:exopolysaccharide biosynthesis protein [Sphingomonas sp.]